MRYLRIKELCKKMGITVTGLEMELGFARGSLSKIDKHLPSADKINRIAERLETTPDYILYGTLNVHKSASGKEYYFDDKTAELAQELHRDSRMSMLMSSSMKLSSEELQAVQTMITALLKKDGRLDD